MPIKTAHGYFFEISFTTPLNSAESIPLEDTNSDSKTNCFLWTANDIFFVTRMKTNAAYEVVFERELPQRRNILANEMIKLTGPNARKSCPFILRRIVVWDAENLRKIILLDDTERPTLMTDTAWLR